MKTRSCHWLLDLLPATRGDVRNLTIYLETIMAILDGIKAEVARGNDLDARILAKLDSLKTNGVDPAEVQSIADALKASNDAKEVALNS